MNNSTPFPLSRREFLKLSAAGLATVALAWQFAPLARAAGGKIPIGLQLWPLKKQCEADLPAVIDALGKMGYQGIEYAPFGYLNRKPGELVNMMKASGVVCCGSHVKFTTLEQNFQETVEFNQALGNKLLIVASVPKERGATKQGWLDVVKFFNETSDKLKPSGMSLAYHAHPPDFKPIEGAVPWDLVFENANRDLVMQLDTGNCQEGGGDPVAVLKKYLPRARTIHLREFGGPADAVIGGGEMRWKEIFALCETGVTEWYVVDHDRPSPDPLGNLKR